MPEIPEVIRVVAIYENGVLRPLKPLSLQEHQTVKIQVLPDNSDAELEAITQSLATAGLLTSPPHRDNVKPVSEAAWHELTEKLKITPGKPLSESIVEDRGGW